MAEGAGPSTYECAHKTLKALSLLSLFKGCPAEAQPLTTNGVRFCFKTIFAQAVRLAGWPAGCVEEMPSAAVLLSDMAASARRTML